VMIPRFVGGAPRRQKPGAPAGRAGSARAEAARGGAGAARDRAQPLVAARRRGRATTFGRSGLRSPRARSCWRWSRRARSCSRRVPAHDLARRQRAIGTGT
jgi:hypothetical protein